MTEKRSTRTWAPYDQRDAATWLAERIARPREDGIYLSPERAIQQVDAAIDEETGRVSLNPHRTVGRAPDPRERLTVDDILAGLLNVPEARRMLDVRELQIIEHGRRLGASWEEIGTALGFTGTGVRQQAMARFQRLSAKHGRRRNRGLIEAIGGYLEANRMALEHQRCAACVCPEKTYAREYCEKTSCVACLEGCPEAGLDDGCRQRNLPTNALAGIAPGSAVDLRVEVVWAHPRRDPNARVRTFGELRVLAGDPVEVPSPYGGPYPVTLAGHPATVVVPAKVWRHTAALAVFGQMLDVSGTVTHEAGHPPKLVATAVRPAETEPEPESTLGEQS